MAVLRRRRRSRSSENGEPRRPEGHPEWVALGIFTLLITAAPLAFGAVDRVVQIALLVLFAAGLAIRPPALVRPTKRVNVLLLVLVTLLAGKEFAPAVLFGHTEWRTVMTEQYGLDLPWTHHPEPGRAVDALLVCGLAVLWLLWVRTLAGKRENRVWIVWALVVAAASVAAVSFLVHTSDPLAIYGLRYTPGWRGFGPFPNRNHTACFLAMGVVMGCGLTTWAAIRQKYLEAAGSALLVALSMAGLLATHSRGGLLALIAGLAIYGALCLAKFRTGRAAAVIAAVGLVLGAAALTGGSQLFSRFSATESSISNDTRVAIWQNAVRMWSDAPLFGHGLNSFPSLFPLYAKVTLDNQVVLHPESSWLLWLSELGLVPMALFAALAVPFLAGHVRLALASHRSFFLYAIGFAVAGALLCHAAIDVPAHRWATAAFALAALGLACRRAGKPAAQAAQELEWNLHAAPRFPRQAAFVPVAVALFWMVPFLFDGPAWAPLTVQRVVAAAEISRPPTEASLTRELDYFPLNPILHNHLGYLRLRQGKRLEEWLPHFALATRLSPGSWGIPVFQARMCGAHWPEQSFAFWKTAIERGGWRGEELFRNALAETNAYSNATQVWTAYIETHPELALEYAVRLPENEMKAPFDLWWKARGLNPEAVLSAGEARTFYSLAPRCSSVELFTGGFMKAHPDRVSEDYLASAQLLHAWGDDARAWQVLSTKLRDPEYPKIRNGVARIDLERRLRLSPESGACAQALAATCTSEGDAVAAREVVIKFAQRPTAPPFFTRKAAYLLFAQGKLAEAVEMLLRG